MLRALGFRVVVPECLLPWVHDLTFRVQHERDCGLGVRAGDIE